MSKASLTDAESPSPGVSPAGIEPAGQKESSLNADFSTHSLKKKTAHGAVISTCGQAANFVLRTGSMVILARLLTPHDFGLVGMVTACTGFVALFQDIGLSMATIQRASVTHEQISTIFWINILVGATLAILCAAMAPVLVSFYHEPRLFWLTVVIGASFVFGGAGSQHRAMLERRMRFGTLAAIDLSALFLSLALGIGMAIGGFGYWAVVSTVVAPVVLNQIGLWTSTGWRPGPPRRGCGVGSMLKYGGTVTLNSVIVYFAYNMDKVLLGRFWGADVLGLYGRAYTLINLPTQNLNTTIAVVAFPALSRLQNSPDRLKSYFLKGYGLFLSLCMPITMACAVFSEDIVHIFLGSKWDAAVPVFRLLAPTIFAFSLFNPFGWFLLATGRATRSLHISFLIAPTLFIGYLAGLSYGANGVAASFSVTVMLLIWPIIFWATRGTSITVPAVLRVAMRPFLSALIGAAVAFAASLGLVHVLTLPILRLVVENAIMFGVYALVLLFVMGQKEVYASLLQEVGVWPFGNRRNIKKETEPPSA